ncbi:phosphotransferase family protein [Acidiferrimicrobium sp. IK]|uniref:phosphotransferase family protein n=1 Tax=Acidiferrimicrobium sp. IK TaxID=2871700 RepID=UPI0039671FBA
MDHAELPGAGAPMEVGFISGGSQNEIFEIRRGDLHCALRKPPASAPAPRDEGILREWRIIDALTGSDVPHTDAVAVCEDASVLGRPFYLMGFVDGWSPMGRDILPEPFASDPEARAGLAYQLVDGIVEMGRFDWQKGGLGDLGRPDGYHDRQVERWTRFLDRIKGRDLPGLDEATAWLSTHRPLDFVPGLMHGDYQFANVMYRHGLPATLAAIVDWEMGTIGDPKLDLAWVLGRWPEDTAAEPDAMGYIDLSGMPGRSEVLDYYSRESGRQVDDFDYYLVLANWKLAIVLEQGYQRAGDDEKLQGFGPIVLDLMASAGEMASTSDYPATAPSSH